jgi:hypothetical protein
MKANPRFQNPPTQQMNQGLDCREQQKNVQNVNTYNEYVQEENVPKTSQAHSK